MCNPVILAVLASVALLPGGVHAQIPVPTATVPQTVTKVADPEPMVASPMDAADGFFVGKIIGATVVDEEDATIGTVKDLIVRHDGKISTAILAVGGLLGVGTKQVSVAFSEVRLGGGKITLTPTAKGELSGLPLYADTK